MLTVYGSDKLCAAWNAKNSKNYFHMGIHPKQECLFPVILSRAENARNKRPHVGVDYTA